MGFPIPATQVTHAAGKQAKPQHVVPRSRDEAKHAAGGIVGIGPDTILTADATTHAQANPCVVMTEGYGDDLSQWQLTSAGKDPAVLQPIIARITAAGWSVDDEGNPVDGWPSGGAVNDNPAEFNIAGDSATNLYDGILANGCGGLIADNDIFYIPGIALYVTRPSTTEIGAQGVFDRLRWSIQHVNSRRVFAGPWFNATDCTVFDIESTSWRDWGIRLGEHSEVGAVQICIFHAYGGGWENSETGGKGAAVWTDGDENQGCLGYGETATFGWFTSGSFNSFTLWKSRGATVCNNLITGNANTFAFGIVRVSVLGTDIHGEYNTIQNTTYTFDSNTDITAIKVTTGNGHTIRDCLIDGYGQNSVKGLICPATLDNCHFTGIRVIGCSVGFDFSHLGKGNLIDVMYTHTDDTQDNPVTPYILPSGWQSETPKRTSNRVFINGFQWFPAEDES